MSERSVDQGAVTTRYLTRIQVEKQTGLPASWIDRNAKAGLIRHVVVGKQRLYTVDDVLAYAEKSKNGGGA